MAALSLLVIILTQRDWRLNIHLIRLCHVMYRSFNVEVFEVRKSARGDSSVYDEVLVAYSDVTLNLQSRSPSEEWGSRSWRGNALSLPAASLSPPQPGVGE